jgi:hypothetical protein
MRLELTEDIVRAASRDAGDRSMRAAGRHAWSQEDDNASCREFDRLAVGLPTEALLRLYGTADVEAIRAGA